MAFLQNPNYGIVPGAPQGLSWWDGNTFRMSGMPPPPVAPLPPVATAATPTPQDTATQQGSGLLAPTTGAGGAQPGGGGPGTGPGGVGGGGQDTTTSGYPGVYAQAPGELNSQFGNVMGTAGMGVPYPGAGTALGALGGFIDASRYNGINAQYGVPGTVNPWGSAAHEILSGIGVPFTDWDLAALFDVPSARARHLGLVDDAGYIGRDAMGYGALAANQPVGPVTRESGQFASYPAGFIESGLQPSHGLPAEQAAQLNLDVERTINANPDVFGVGPAGGGPTPGGDYGNIDVSPGPGPDQGGYGPGAGAGPGGKGVLLRHLVVRVAERELLRLHLDQPVELQDARLDEHDGLHRHGELGDAHHREPLIASKGQGFAIGEVQRRDTEEAGDAVLEFAECGLQRTRLRLGRREGL
jgi:hypothetical protein